MLYVISCYGLKIIFEKEKVKLEYPNKSDSWYKNKIRELRKQKTIDFAKTLGVNTESDNVADSVGIAWWGSNG